MFLVSSTFGELSFETMSLEKKAAQDNKSVMFEFPFEVKEKDVEIKSLAEMCPCLSAWIEPRNPDRSMKKSWKVGEKGTIKVKFDTMSFVGKVEKAVGLQLKGEQKLDYLKVAIVVPELIKMEPRTLKWDQGGKAEAKVLKITMQGDEPIKVLGVSATRKEAFPYELKTIKEGKEYELHVTPTDVSKGGICVFRFLTDAKNKRFKRAVAYASVRRPSRVKPVKPLRKAVPAQ